MKYSILFKSLVAVAVICGITYLVQSCKKSQGNPYYIPFYIEDVGSYGCLIVGNTIQFTYFNDGGLINTVLWNFGDGTTSTDGDHVYHQVGTYRVTLIINNDTCASWPVQIAQEYGRSRYSFQMSGIRSWNGYNDIVMPEYFIHDSSLAVQAIDSGTIVFVGDTLHLINIDTINNKLLTYSDCGQASLFYYYSTDSIIYNHIFPQGKTTFNIELHSP